MALDEALADSVRDGGAPFLRFYTWKPGTLSLGRFQHPTTGLGDAAHEVPRVRRTTGGGAIWHDDELTYSLGCTQADLGITGVKASFEKLGGFLLDTWKALGWDARYARDQFSEQRFGTPTPACFAGTEEYDILVKGQKLGGNAQRRDRSTIFQHGSIPRSLDHERLDALFLPGFRPLSDAITDLESCGWTKPVTALIPLLTEAFRVRTAQRWEESEPTAAELERTQVLIQEKYGNREWTETGAGHLRSG